jgi:hypothetical protein
LRERQENILLPINDEYSYDMLKKWLWKKINL